MSKIMTPILDELNRGHRIEKMLETLTDQARKDFFIELADLFCSFGQEAYDQKDHDIITRHLNTRFPQPTPTPAAAPVKEFDPYDL
jgi:hypothetical protein